MSAKRTNPLTPADSGDSTLNVQRSTLNVQPDGKKLCPCGRPLIDWREICAECFNSLPMELRKELKLHGKHTPRHTVNEILAHAASRVNGERRRP